MTQFEVRQFSNEMFTANAAGRAPFENDFVDSSLLDITGVSPSILATKIVGDRVQQPNVSNPSASTLDVTTLFGFNTTGSVDPVTTAVGKCSLIEFNGGTEFDTATGLVASAAQQNSSMVPICDVNGQPILSSGDRVWGVITTANRAAGNTHTLRFFSGAFKSGSETAYTMNQDFIVKIPEKFTLQDRPVFSDVSVVMFDDAQGAILTPNSITDLELSTTIEAYGPTIQEIRQHEYSGAWIEGANITNAAGLTADISPYTGYFVDGTRQSGGAGLGVSVGVFPGAGNFQAFLLVLQTNGTLVRRDGSVSATSPAPEDWTLNAGDIPIYKLETGGTSTIVQREDRRITYPHGNRYKKTFLDGNGATVQFFLPFRPSRNAEGEYMMNVRYSGGHAGQVLGTPTNVTEYSISDDPTIGFSITFGAAPATGVRNIEIETWSDGVS